MRPLDAFLAAPRSLPWLLREPRLRRPTLAIAAVAAAILVALLVTLIFFTGPLLSLVWSPPGGAARALWWLAFALLFVLLFAIGAVSLPAIATAPLADWLSAEVERALGAPPPVRSEPVRETLRSIGKTAMRVVILLAGQGLLLVLWLVPVAGAPLASLLGAAWSGLWLAWEYLDVAANRHGLSFRDVVSLVKANAGVAAGLGASLWLLLLVPVVNVLLVPAAVAGATRVFVELRAAGRVPGLSAEPVLL